MKILTYILPFQLTLLACVVAITGFSQVANKPNTTAIQAPAPTTTPRSLPPNINSLVKQNFIRKREAKAPITSETSFSTASYLQVAEQTHYFDHIGRKLQTVFRQQSSGATPKDLVQPYVIQPGGLEEFSYLPYLQSTGTSTSDGKLKFTPFPDQDNFYKTVYKDADNNIMYRGESFFYSKQEVDGYNLGRTTKVFEAGNSWIGSNRSTDKIYLNNTAAEGIRIWTITNNQLTYVNEDINTNIPASTANQTYASGQLTKGVTKDEQGNAVVEYYNDHDLLILKKVQLKTIPADYSGQNNAWLCTYYVYDEYDRLRFVIPPAAVDAIQSTWSFSAATNVVNELCYRYEYDDQNRMIAARKPGARWEYMVYDSRDRLVFVQDGNMRSNNQWLTHLYDLVNRRVVTGMLVCSLSRNSLQSHVDAQMNGGNISVSGTVASPLMSKLAVPSRINGLTLYQATQEIEFSDGFISETGADFIAEIAPGGTTPFTNNMSIVINPLPPGYTMTPLILNFFDNYGWTTDQYTDGYNSLLDPGVAAFPEPTLSASEQAQNTTFTLSTGSRIRVIEDPANLAAGKWLTSTQFFDSKNRVIQVNAENYYGGRDITAMRYNFTGKVIATYSTVTKPQSNFSNIRILTGFEYDHMDRLLKIWKTLNDAQDKKTLIESNTYDELGRLKRKELGQQRDDNGDYTALPIETLDHTYNVRGWIKGINPSYSHPDLNGGNAPSRWFGMEFSYDWGAGISQYQGNISAINWRSKGDDERRAYGYTYDNSGRILGADFSQFSSGNYADHATIKFDMVMGDGIDPLTAYDLNGNIKALKQLGLLINASPWIDQLTYAYHTNSNKLKRVDELTPPGDNKLGDFADKNAGTSDDYGYDVNGNLVTDLNKRIMSTTGMEVPSGGDVKYNHLNLPWKVTIKEDGTTNTKGITTYIYDAMGRKLEKRIQDNTNVQQPNKRVAYVGSAIFENDDLQSVSHEDGRVRLATSPGSTDHWYDYYIKDQVSNVRMVLTDELRESQVPMASMETANATTEEAVYSRIPETRSPKPSGYPTDNTTNPNNNASKVSGNGQKIGVGITLKVMAGDKFIFSANSWYNRGTTPITPPYDPSGDILNVLLNGIGVASGGKVASAVLQSSGVLVPPIGSFIQRTDRVPNGTSPKAFVNWVMLDEQFNYVSNGSGCEQVGANNVFSTHARGWANAIEASKNGYLYIFVSNETPDIDVYFDNLVVTKLASALSEETHYYPFGLTMAGISSKASGIVNNKSKFQGQEFASKEFSDGSGLEMYEFKWRMHDPQLGRFWQVDPKADEYRYNSPYAFSENRVVNGRELEGLEYVSIHHYSDGRIGTKMFYKSSDKEINERGGTTANGYYSASFGPLGRGVVHYYYTSSGQIIPTATAWDQKQKGGISDLAYHGLYSGSGSITKNGGQSDQYDFSFQPIDWADAIAKRHDMDYVQATASGEKYSNFLEDTRTLKADEDMLLRIHDLKLDMHLPFRKMGVEGVETPFNTGKSDELIFTLDGQASLIATLFLYKQWKIHMHVEQKTYAELRDSFYKYDAVSAKIIDGIDKALHQP